MINIWSLIVSYSWLLGFLTWNPCKRVSSSLIPEHLEVINCHFLVILHLEVDSTHQCVCVHDVTLEYVHEWRYGGLTGPGSLLRWYGLLLVTRDHTRALELAQWDVDLANDFLVLDELVNVPEDQHEAPVLQEVQVIDWSVNWRQVLLFPGNVLEVLGQLIPFVRLLARALKLVDEVTIEAKLKVLRHALLSLRS